MLPNDVKKSQTVLGRPKYLYFQFCKRLQKESLFKITFYVIFVI